MLEREGYTLPRTVQEYLDFTPRNPDLVLYNPETKQWRFCEVKRDEAVQKEQVATLAFLHVLMDAPVAIVRLVPKGHRRRLREHPTQFVYGGPLDVAFRIPVTGCTAAKGPLAEGL